MRAPLSVPLLAILTTLGGCARSPAPAPRAAIARADGAWLWTAPIALTPETATGLQTLGVDELYALAGTFSNDGERFVLQFRRGVSPPPSQPPTLHLVYRFDKGGTHRALDDAPATTAALIARTFAEDRRKAEAAGWRVVGLQLDLDAPTARLPRYGEVLTALRKAVSRPTLLSVTGLATWLDGGDVGDALAAVDFWCPQLYEFAPPTLLANPAPISSAPRLAALLPKIERTGLPYRVGIAAYGQALLYRDGRLAGTYRDLSPSEAARLYPRDPAVAGDAGEERAGYRLNARTTLLFRRPSRTSVETALNEVRARRGLCAGFVLFRAPAEREELPLSPATIARPPAPRGLSLMTGEASDPFRAIEAPGGLPPREAVDRSVTLRVSAASPLDPPLRSDGVRVEIRWSPGAAASLLPGDFPGLVLLGPEGESGVSLARSSGARAIAPWLRAGKPLSLGPIVLKSGKLRGRVTVSGYSGDETREFER